MIAGVVFVRVMNVMTCLNKKNALGNVGIKKTNKGGFPP